LRKFYLYLSKGIITFFLSRCWHGTDIDQLVDALCNSSGK